MDPKTEISKNVEVSAEPRINALIRSESMKLASENPQKNSGEIHTLNQLENDLTANPFIARALEKHFQVVYQAISERTSKFGENIDSAWSTVISSAAGASSLTETKKDYLIAEGHGRKERLVSISALSNDYPTEITTTPSYYSDTSQPAFYRLGAEVGYNGRGTISITEGAFEMAKNIYIKNSSSEIHQEVGAINREAQNNTNDESIKNLPQNIKEQAQFFLGKDLKIKEKQVSPENTEYIFSYTLNDIENLFPGQVIDAEVKVNGQEVAGTRLGNIEIGIKVNGQIVDLDSTRNKDSKTEIRWGGGTGIVRKDRVELNGQNIPDIKLDKFATTFDLIAFIHESSHTKQPIEILSAAERETDLKTKAALSIAMEKDAWEKTKTALTNLGLRVDNKKMDTLISSFNSEHEAGRRGALTRSSYESLPTEVTMEEALNLVRNKVS